MWAVADVNPLAANGGNVSRDDPYVWRGVALSGPKLMQTDDWVFHMSRAALSFLSLVISDCSVREDQPTTQRAIFPSQNVLETFQEGLLRCHVVCRGKCIYLFIFFLAAHFGLWSVLLTCMWDLWRTFSFGCINVQFAQDFIHFFILPTSVMWEPLRNL